jgi:ABC-type uncharacterized transport system ATPase subunit
MSEMDAWETNAPEEITLKGLTELCEKLIMARETKDVINDELKKIAEQIDELEMKILNIMKENALPNFKGAFGTISIKNNKSVAQPEDMQAKIQLFDYLRSQGIFEEMVSVNSRTLSSWANKEIEAREKQGVFGWVPPGLKTPNEYQSLSVRKK